MQGFARGVPPVQKLPRRGSLWQSGNTPPKVGGTPFAKTATAGHPRWQRVSDGLEVRGVSSASTIARSSTSVARRLTRPLRHHVTLVTLPRWGERRVLRVREKVVSILSFQGCYSAVPLSVSQCPLHPLQALRRSGGSAARRHGSRR